MWLRHIITIWNQYTDSTGGWDLYTKERHEQIISQRGYQMQ